MVHISESPDKVPKPPKERHPKNSHIAKKVAHKQWKRNIYKRNKEQKYVLIHLRCLPNCPKTGPPKNPLTMITQDLICIIAFENAKLITSLLAAVLRVLCLQKLMIVFSQGKIEVTWTYRKNRNIIKKLPEREMPLKNVMNKLMNKLHESERMGNTSNSLGTTSRQDGKLASKYAKVTLVSLDMRTASSLKYNSASIHFEARGLFLPLLLRLSMRRKNEPYFTLRPLNRKQRFLRPFGGSFFSSIQAFTVKR